MPESMRDRAEKFREMDLRMEQVFSLSCISDFMALPDQVEEALEDFEGIQDDTGIEMDLEDDESAEEVAEALLDHGYSGYFAQFAQPRIRISDGVPKFTWGYYGTRWFYADTLDQCIKQALQWAEQNWRMVQGKEVANG